MLRKTNAVLKKLRELLKTRVYKVIADNSDVNYCIKRAQEELAQADNAITPNLKQDHMARACAILLIGLIKEEA